MKAKIFFSCIIIIVIFFACSSVNQISKRNLAFLYNSEQSKIKADFTVFHTSKEISTLYFRFATSELLYAKPNNSMRFRAGVKLSYKLLKNYDSKDIIDSSHVLILDSVSQYHREIVNDSLNFRAAFPNIYTLYVSLTDINKRTISETIINIDKSNAYSRQNFLVRKSNNLPYFKSYFASNENLRISVNSDIANRISVKHFKLNFPPALPPFADQKELKVIVKPDSVFYHKLKNKQTGILKLQQTGIYYFQYDTMVKKGLALFRYYDDFPEITSPSNMLNPLIYISSKKEFDRMLLSKDKKGEVDKFWIEIAGNPDRALQLIKKYYTRVKEANEFFTSYQEGWKTDRGIIYIIYGPPNVVYKSDETETWVYGQIQNIRSITFNFDKLFNSFSDNDYVLNRSSNYKNSWYMAVETWRR
jgi:GWxTD domain-containing protein